MNEAINYVEFPSSRMEATRTFFEDVFQWDFQDYGPDYMAFSNSGLEGGFFRSELRSTVDSGGALVVLYTEDLEDAQERVLSHGGTIAREILSFPGGRRFHFLEPSGNELAVWSDK